MAGQLVAFFPAAISALKCGGFDTHFLPTLDRPAIGPRPSCPSLVFVLNCSSCPAYEIPVGLKCRTKNNCNEWFRARDLKGSYLPNTAIKATSPLCFGPFRLPNYPKQNSWFLSKRSSLCLSFLLVHLYLSGFIVHNFMYLFIYTLILYTSTYTYIRIHLIHIHIIHSLHTKPRHHYIHQNRAIHSIHYIQNRATHDTGQPPKRDRKK